MKRYLTLALLVLGFVAARAQQEYKVSTGDEKRGILLEEYTGAYCHNCPQGHAVAKALATGFGGQLQVVCIHTGNYSPGRGDFILRTDDGEDIARAFVPKGYPSGMISRHDFNGVVHGRDGWKSLSNRLKDEIAAVNLYAEAVYDDATRELNIHVEGYNATDNSTKDMRLNVLFTQDNIIGHQEGAANSDSYSHMHVLRDYITPTSGDAISSRAAGEYFTTDYHYTLPTDIKGQEVKPEDINIIVFVTNDGMNDVANVKGFKPEYRNMNIKAQAELLSPDIPVGEIYGYQYLEANVRNMSAERVTSAVFDVNINGDVTEVTAPCDIAPFTTGAVTVPCTYEIKESAKVSYELSLKRLNDTDVDVKKISGSFACPYIVGNEVRILIKTDKAASENEFLLKDKAGNVVMTFGPFENGKGVTFDKKVKLEKADTYCIEITDSFGNGLDEGRRGSLNVTDNNNLIDYIDNIEGFGARVFFTIENDLGIDGITVDDSGDGRTYTVSGMIVDGDDNGERIVIRNGRKYIKR